MEELCDRAARFNVDLKIENSDQYEKPLRMALLIICVNLYVRADLAESLPASMLMEWAVRLHGSGWPPR